MVLHYEKKGRDKNVLQDEYMELKLPSCDIYVVCDGVTGKKYTREGIFSVVYTIADHITHLEKSNISCILLKDVISNSIYQSIKEISGFLKIDKHELASTLIMLIYPVSDRSVYYSVHLGDGCIFRVCGDHIEGISYPVHGVFLNQTYTTSSSHIRENVRVYKHAAREGEKLVIMTDGLYNYIQENASTDIIMEKDFVKWVEEIDFDDDIALFIKE